MIARRNSILAWWVFPILLTVGTRADEPETATASTFAPVVMECQGSVRITVGKKDPVEISDCSGDALPETYRWIAPGSRWQVLDGRLVILKGSSTMTLVAGDLFHQPHRRTKKGDLGDSWKSTVDALVAVFGRRTVDTVLKGDDGESTTQPFLTFCDEEYLASLGADGLTLRQWKGQIRWHGIPTFARTALRAYGDGKLIFGPEALEEPVVDLEVLPLQKIDDLRLELLVVDSPYMPNRQDLSLPMGPLLSLTRKPVRAVLVTHLSLSHNPRPRPDGSPWDQAVAQGDLTAATAIAAHHGFWSEARRLAGPNPDEKIAHRLSGLDMIGSLPHRQTPETRALNP